MHSMNYEEMLRQSNLDHEQALKEKERQIAALQARLLQQVTLLSPYKYLPGDVAQSRQYFEVSMIFFSKIGCTLRLIYVLIACFLFFIQREDIAVILLREKSVKYYGSLLTSSVDAALLNGARELSEDNIVSYSIRDKLDRLFVIWLVLLFFTIWYTHIYIIYMLIFNMRVVLLLLQRYMSKVTSTLNYLLNDGDITHSIEKEVTEAELGSTNTPISLDAGKTKQWKQE